MKKEMFVINKKPSIEADIVSHFSDMMRTIRDYFLANSSNRHLY